MSVHPNIIAPPRVALPQSSAVRVGPSAEGLFRSCCRTYARLFDLMPYSHTGCGLTSNDAWRW